LVVPALAATFPGKATVGKNSAKADFVYDTGNEVPGTILDPQFANDLGLGTWDKKKGVFTPPKGTKGLFSNDKAYSFWCFDDVTISGTDSKGNVCDFKQQVYVIKSRDGEGKGEGSANKSLEGENIVNQDWINGVKAGQIGAGAKATHQWPAKFALKRFKNAVPVIDTPSGAVQQTFGVTFSTPLISLTGDVVYESVSDYTFLTEAQATALGLTVVDSIDLSVVDPLSLNAIGWAFQNRLNQTVFDVAELENIDLFGSGPGDFLSTASGRVLILDSGNSDFGILGNDFLAALGNRVGYANGAGSGGVDQFFTVPESAGVVYVIIAGMSLLASHCTFNRRTTQRGLVRDGESS